MACGNSCELLNWLVLHHEAKHILEKVQSGWIELLARPGQNEEAFHSYLSEHAGMFFADSCHRIVVISKLRLGADLVTDFVITNDQRSYGFTYRNLAQNSGSMLIGK
jgi:hypothetical protein